MTESKGTTKRGTDDTAARRAAMAASAAVLATLKRAAWLAEDPHARKIAEGVAYAAYRTVYDAVSAEQRWGTE